MCTKAVPSPTVYLVFAALAQILFSSSAGAQSMTVLGGDSYARECYTAATFAALMHSASREDLETCTNALDYGKLSTRDLLATYVNRGVVYVALEEYQKAARDYATALNLEPRSGEVYVNRGNLSFLDKAYSEAIAEYTKALELGLAKSHIAHFNRGMAHEHAGDLADAEADYRRAAELAPEWAQPQAKLDLLMRKLGKPPAVRQN